MILLTGSSGPTVADGDAATVVSGAAVVSGAGGRSTCKSIPSPYIAASPQVVVILAGTLAPPVSTVTPSKVVMVVVPFPSVTILDMGTVATVLTVYPLSTWVAYHCCWPFSDTVTLVRALRLLATMARLLLSCDDIDWALLRNTNRFPGRLFEPCVNWSANVVSS